MTAVRIPCICCNLGVGATEVGGDEEVVAVAEDTACFISIPMVTRSRVPMGPLLPVLLSVKRPASPLGEGIVDPGVKEGTDGTEIFVISDLGRNLIGGLIGRLGDSR